MTDTEAAAMEGVLVVPELNVTDIAASLRFWCGLLALPCSMIGRRRLSPIFPKDGAEVMLEQLGPDSWHVGE